jgi:hypothetical protein
VTTPLVAPSLAPLAAALLDRLRTSTGRPIGDLGAPADAGLPYGFLSRGDTRWTGSLRNPHEMVVVIYQVQCVALDTAGVEYLEHRVRQALATPPAAAGFRILRYLPPDGPAGIRLDRDVTPHLAFSTPRFTITAQPA